MDAIRRVTSLAKLQTLMRVVSEFMNWVLMHDPSAIERIAYAAAPVSTSTCRNFQCSIY